MTCAQGYPFAALSVTAKAGNSSCPSLGDLALSSCEKEERWSLERQGQPDKYV